MDPCQGQSDVDHSRSKEEVTQQIPQTSKLQSDEGRGSMGLRGHILIVRSKCVFKAISLEWRGMVTSPRVTLSPRFACFADPVCPLERDMCHPL
jgi:hypothetical protein